MLERHLNKTILRAPADGVVSVIVAEIGENVHAGQPVLVIEETGKQFLSFNVREDLLHGLTVGTSVNIRRSGAAERRLFALRSFDQFNREPTYFQAPGGQVFGIASDHGIPARMRQSQLQPSR